MGQGFVSQVTKKHPPIVRLLSKIVVIKAKHAVLTNELGCLFGSSVLTTGTCG